MAITQPDPLPGRRSEKGPPEGVDPPFKLRVRYVSAVAVAIGLAVAVLWFVGDVFLLLFAGILFAVLLQGLSHWVQEKLRLSYIASFGLVLGGILLVLALAAVLLAPQVARQMDDLVATLPGAIQRLRAQLGSYGWLQSILQQLPPADQMMAGVASMLSQVKSIFSGVLGAIANIIIIAFVSIYLAARPGLYTEGLIILLPRHRRERGREVLADVGHALRAWLLGKLFAMAVVGTVSAIALGLLGVPLALTLGIIAGLFDFIPYLGPVLAGVPAVLIALTESPTLALWVVVLFVGIQLAEGYLLEPLVARKMVSMPPALTIMMQVLLGVPFGLAGIALATPLTAVLMVLTARLYVEGVLGDNVKIPGQR